MPRPPLPPERHRAMVGAVVEEIARVGFEGLRVRAVAQAAGIHHATLLHHFPSKQALVEAVVEAMEADFRHLRTAAPPDGAEIGALELLRLEYEDTRLRLHSERQTLTVWLEIALRAGRDDAVAAAVRRMYAGWRGHLAAIVRDGMAGGVFSPALDPAEVAGAIMAQVQGMALAALSGATPAEIDRLVATASAMTEAAVLRHGTHAQDREHGVGGATPD